MNAVTTKTVRELAIEMPNATRVFEKLGIDYCCGGKKPLEEACHAANLNVDEVLNALEEANRQPAQTSEKELQSGSLAELIDHIVTTHHKFVREEVARLHTLATKVNSVHGKNHPELGEVLNAFTALAQDLTLHLMKEEQVLFPYVIRMEEAYLQHESVVPAPFGTVNNPIHMMMQEHDVAGDFLRQIRKASKDFTVPQDACVSYRTFYQALEAFEADLHQHIHKENNILFPRATAMETTLRKAS